MPSRTSSWLFVILLWVTPCLKPVRAAGPEAPTVSNFELKNGRQSLRFSPYPAAQSVRILRAPTILGPYVEDTSGILAGYDWSAPFAGASPGDFGFYRVEIEPIGSDELLASTVLDRLGYGATPDELQRLTAGANPLGARAYIEEQLAPELIQEQLEIDHVPAESGWQYVKVTGTASSSTLYIYLESAGEVYLDDLKLVRGSAAETGTSVIVNGDFEAPLAGMWTISANHTASALSTTVKHSGNASLHLVAATGGTTRESSVWQSFNPTLRNGDAYTLSYWYLPTATSGSLTIRLSQSGIVSQPTGSLARLRAESARIDDLQEWYILHAVETQKQLLEVLTQFFDNHFTTFYTKSRDYVDGRVEDSSEDEVVATAFEFRELMKWRDVLQKPNGTFYDMLRISAESPAMIIYLDTVTSNRDAANENYARELMELFTMGVDNGYDQQDIEEVSRAWTGWNVDKLPLAQKDNPFANRVPDRDDPGYWTLQFRRARHDETSKRIFPGKVIHPRFGAPHAGKSYELSLPARTGTNGIKDGFEIIAHLADLPYTQEYLCVKLCQVFVHENFHHAVYDYTLPNLSPEASLVRDCMRAWDTPAADGRKGNLRQVLRVIFDSELFRSHAASRQKVKTPFEYTVSAVRAIRAARGDGTFTASSNGTHINTALNRLSMRLFYREDPDGWSEFGKDWINTSALVERMRFVQGFLANTSLADPVGLLKLKLPTAQWRDANAVAGLFTDTLFPGEGQANLDLDRRAAADYLNSNSAASGPLFATLSPSSTEYNTRVRGMVAMLLCLPRFQEQ